MLTYKKLRVLMAERNIEWKTLVKDGIVTQNTRRLLVKDEYVAIQTLERIANYLNVDIGDIVSIRREK